MQITIGIATLLEGLFGEYHSSSAALAFILCHKYICIPQIVVSLVILTCNTSKNCFADMNDFTVGCRLLQILYTQKQVWSKFELLHREIVLVERTLPLILFTLNIDKDIQSGCWPICFSWNWSGEWYVHERFCIASCLDNSHSVDK